MQPGVQGKVVFIAPTKPLVNQQIEACYEFMGVSKVKLPAAMAPYSVQTDVSNRLSPNV